MLVPTHCQTCGEVIGHLWKPYVELVQKYSKDREESELTPEYRARQELIEKHGLDGRKQCCLYALMVNYDISDMIT